jgi:hypothetical protein
VYDEWFSLESVNTQLLSSRFTKILWLLTAISGPLSTTFSFERPPFRARDTALHLSDLLPSLQSNVAEGVYYFFSESISQWCEWWLNNEWTQPRSLTPGEISEVIFETESKEARVSSDGITDIGRGWGGGVNGDQGCHNNNWMERH